MSGFRFDKSWSDQFLPAIKGLLGQHLIATADWTQDAEQATDLIVLELAPLSVGCRIRRHTQAQYSDEFTIRCSRPSGAQTEMAKICSGWGTHIFYGFSCPTGGLLDKWFIGDLKVFRDTLIRHPRMARVKPKRNRDRSSEFQHWRVDLFPEAFVVASGGHDWRQQRLMGVG